MGLSYTVGERVFTLPDDLVIGQQRLLARLFAASGAEGEAAEDDLRVVYDNRARLLAILLHEEGQPLAARDFDAYAAELEWCLPDEVATQMVTDFFAKRAGRKKHPARSQNQAR